MKMKAGSSPALATALLLAASAVTVSGCGKPEAFTPAVRDPMTVIAIVTYDGKTTRMTTSQGLPDKLIRLSERFHDTVQWSSPYGEVHIVKWTPKSPFDKDPVHEWKVLKSGPPSRGAHVQKEFKYDAELWLDPEGKNRVSIDPRIEIME